MNRGYIAVLCDRLDEELAGAIERAQAAQRHIRRLSLSALATEAELEPALCKAEPMGKLESVNEAAAKLRRALEEP